MIVAFSNAYLTGYYLRLPEFDKVIDIRSSKLDDQVILSFPEVTFYIVRMSGGMFVITEHIEGKVSTIMTDGKNIIIPTTYPEQSVIIKEDGVYINGVRTNSTYRSVQLPKLYIKVTQLKNCVFIRSPLTDVAVIL